MNTYQKRSLQAFRRVQAWLVAHPALGASAVSNAHVVADLDGVVTQLTTAAAEQDGQDRAARGAALETKRARTELVVHQMRHVAVIAESAIPDVVKMVAAFRRPVQTDNESLIAQADAMATAASQYEAVLTQRGLAPDFVEALRDASMALRQAIDSRGSAIGLRHKAGEGIHEIVKRGGRVVDALSVIIARQYRGDTATLAEWKQVRRVTLVGPRSSNAAPSVIDGASLLPNGASLLPNGASHVPNGAQRVLNAGSSEVNAAAA